MQPTSLCVPRQLQRCSVQQRRLFHDYFVTHLPSSSLHPDARSAVGPNHHKLPRSESTPHGPTSEHRSPAQPQSIGVSRETTVVRIPLKSAKHHFGAGSARGSRPYNEDKYQAGTIGLPAFAKRQPLSISRRIVGKKEERENQAAQNAGGDPQVFYFGVFDGHGGEECSNFLRDRLHSYVEDAAERFGMKSSLVKVESETGTGPGDGSRGDKQNEAIDLQRSLVSSWRDTVGGYFKRFKPEYFTALDRSRTPEQSTSSSSPENPLSVEALLTYAFLKADLDFTTAQAHKHSPSPTDDDPILDDRPLNDDVILSHPSKPASQNFSSRAPIKSQLGEPIGGKTRFKGGSTASLALISTPSPTPFWHPASPSTLIVAHVGDTRILLCRVNDGQAVPLTTNHHPSTSFEATRLRRYAAAFVTDSFGEERVLGLANTRAFGDISSKRIGVSAEPEISTTQLAPSEYSFVALMSDGVSGALSDQEVVDIVKEARTPDQASRDVVNFATEVSEEADNATCLVVRLGGWERRSEGGGGSLGTKEMREFKRRDAEDPRSRRQFS